MPVAPGDGEGVTEVWTTGEGTGEGGRIAGEDADTDCDG